MNVCSIRFTCRYCFVSTSLMCVCVCVCACVRVHKYRRRADTVAQYINACLPQVKQCLYTYLAYNSLFTFILLRIPVCLPRVCTMCKLGLFKNTTTAAHVVVSISTDPVMKSQIIEYRSIDAERISHCLNMCSEFCGM